MNSIVNRVEKDFLEAYKAKDELKTSVLRMIKSSLRNMAIDKKGELEEADAVRVLQRELKQRRDAILQYRTGGRPDLADKEELEIRIIESYLPAQMSETELREIIQAAVSETGASSKADFGKVMGKVMPTVNGKAEGNAVSRIVNELLGK